MKANIEKIDGFTVVTLDECSIDSAGVKAFKQAMQPAVDAGGIVILDMNEVEFVDSSGLGALLSTMRQLTSRNGELRICSMRKQVRSLFELVRFHRILDVFDSPEKAMRG